MKIEKQDLRENIEQLIGEGVINGEEIDVTTNKVVKLVWILIDYLQTQGKNNGDLGNVSERYPKDCVLEYEDGWYITFKSPSGNIIKSHGPYKTKAIAEHDRRTLNAR